jgi:anti-sigma B factor antagonist
LRLSRKETPVRTPPDPDLGSSGKTSGPLLINTRRDGDSAAIALSGELDLASADELDAAIRSAEEAGTGRVVVDLSGVSFIDSTGLSVLLRAKKRSDGRLRYVPSNHDAVTRLLELTGTIEMLD